MIAVCIIVVGGIVIAAWSCFWNQQLNQAKSILADFQDPLPPGFKFTGGIGLLAEAGIGPKVSALHEPTGMTITLSKALLLLR